MQNIHIQILHLLFIPFLRNSTAIQRKIIEFHICKTLGGISAICIHQMDFWIRGVSEQSSLKLQELVKKNGGKHGATWKTQQIIFRIRIQFVLYQNAETCKQQ